MASESVKEAQDRLREMTDRLTDSAEWQRTLKACATFHQYSWGNVLLILTQDPEATAVKGFKSWLSLGRAVRKGEKGIRILAPRPYRKEREDGSEEHGMSFGVTSVFDIRQTDPIPGYPNPFVPISLPDVLGDEEAAARLYEALSAHVASTGVSVTEVDDLHAYGLYDHRTLAITIRRDAPLVMASTLIHESAHAVQRAADVGFGKGGDEVAAEAIAYIVGSRFGLDSGNASATYIATYLRSDPDGFRKTASFVAKAAGEIIAAVERAMAPGLPAEDAPELAA